MKMLKTNFKKHKSMPLIGWCGDLEIYTYKGKLYSDNKRLICRLPNSKFSVCHLINRLLRKKIRCSINYDNGLIFFFRKTIYFLSNDLVLTEIKNDFRFESAPLYLAKFVDADNNEIILFGDYGNNKNRQSVNIYSIKDKKISLFYTFVKKTMKHIHNIIVKGEYGYILSGDDDGESAIWRLNLNNKSCIKLFDNKQEFRSCYIDFTENEEYIVLPDTPLDINYIRIVKKETIHKLEINGPVINAVSNENYIFFATTIEPDASLNTIPYLLTLNRANCIKENKVFVYCFNKGTLKLSKLFEFKKDIFPAGLFGFGNAKLFLKNNFLYVVPESVVKYNNKTVIFDINEVEKYE